MRSHRRNDEVDRRIDENLKRAFDHLANEPVPERFTDLLKQLREKDPTRRDKGNENE